MRPRHGLLLLIAACLLGLGACGGGDDEPAPAAQATAPTGATGPTAATGPTGPSRTTEQEPPPAPPQTTGTATTPPTEPTESGTPGPGDEEPIRQPVRFRVGGAEVKPSSVSVAPFLTIELELENVASTPLIVRLVGTDVTIELAPGETRTRRLEGLKAGLYTLSVNDGAQVATVVVGDDVGP